MINRDDTKKIIKIAGLIVVLLFIIAYALFESNSLIKGPEIILTSPHSGDVFSTSSVNVKGMALRIQDITLNGRPILIDQSGNFEETLLLAPGYNVSLFRAKDKFNRTIEYKFELVYEK
jgi:hypothetical protein